MRPLRLPSFRRLLIQLNLDMDAISEYVAMHRFGDHTTFHTMVLLLEDRRFRRHLGIDYWSFVRDAWRFITFRRHGGFSTIEMQFVRTVTRRYERTVGRKIYEMLLAHLCNWHFTKADVLNSYLSIAYYGYRYPVKELYGIMSNFEIVASDLFGKPVDALSLEEARRWHHTWYIPAQPHRPKRGCSGFQCARTTRYACMRDAKSFLSRYRVFSFFSFSNETGGLPSS